MTARLTQSERRAAARYARGMDRNRPMTPPEPALGTLDERLSIIIRRHGGHTGPIVLTPSERAQLASYRLLTPEA